jgi:HEAT repeat protein
MFSFKNWSQRLLLTKRFKSDDAAEREAVVDELGNLADAEAIKMLVACFKDPSASVRKAAAGALRRIADPGTLDAMIEALGDKGFTGAWHVELLAAIEQFNDPRAVPACINALDYHDSRVRRAAAETLGSLGDPSAIEPLLKGIEDADADYSQHAAYAVAKFGQAALPGLLKIMASGATQAKISTCVALGIIGDPAGIPPLLAALKSKDSYLQIAAAKTLPSFNNPVVIQPLVEALEISATAAFYYGVRDEAEAALLKIGPTAIDALTAAVKRASQPGQLAIIKLLREMPDPRSFTPLTELLADSPNEVRKAALAALLKVDRQQAVTHLLPLLQDPDFTIRHCAGEALLGAGWKAEHPLDRARHLIALGQYGPALKEGADVLPLVVERLKDAEAQVRREAAHALAALKDEKLLPEFQAAAVVEKESEAQGAFIEAIESFGAPIAIAALVVLLENGCWTMRRRAGQSLIHHEWQPANDNQRAILALTTGKADAVAAVGAAVIPLLETAIGSGDADIMATATLARQKIPAA